MKGGTRIESRFSISRQELLLGLPWILGIAAAMPAVWGYVRMDFNLLLCLIAIPLTVKFSDQPARFSLKYGLLALLFFAAHAILKIKFPYLIAFGFFLLFLAESQRGKRINTLPIWLIFLASPVQIYLSQVAGGTLRMKISGLADTLLNLLGQQVEVAGNRFVVGPEQEVFYVDPACAGLDMLLTTWVFAILFAGYQESRQGKWLSLPVSTLLMAVTFLFVLLANLMRITGLVWLKFPPETAMHEAMGIICLMFYALLPTWFVARLMVRYFGKKVPPAADSSWKIPGKPAWLLTGVLLALLTFFSIRQNNYKNPMGANTAIETQLPGFERSVTPDGIERFLGENSLVFVKPPVNFWGADHNPSICWRADGYALRGEREAEIAGRKVWLAELHKENEQMLTAWWYDNGKTITTGQWEWRKRAMKGEKPFSLINVTVTDPAKMATEVEKVMDMIHSGGPEPENITVGPESGLGFCNLPETR